MKKVQCSTHLSSVYLSPLNLSTHLGSVSLSLAYLFIFNISVFIADLSLSVSSPSIALRVCLFPIFLRQGILRLIVQNQKGKRKAGENEGERFRNNPGGGVCTPQTVHHHSHSSYNAFQHTNIPRDLPAKKLNTSHSSSTPSSSLKRQKFTPHN